MPSSSPSNQTNFVHSLNTPQQQAVLHEDGPLLVLAGAGSGKTRVITYRIARLLALRSIPPWEILAVTFTNKAARELRERLDQLVGPEVASGLWVGTFHATCARLLRRHYDAVGLTKDFVIYDADDQKAVMKRVVKQLDIDDKRFPPKTLLGWVHEQKHEGRRPEELSTSNPFEVIASKAYVAYQDHLHSCNAVDFDDLILNVALLVERRDDPDATELRAMFSHVLVDEFQDVNLVQYRLVRALASRHQNLCVVGDDDQSIYSWRGADVSIIRGFKRDFPSTRVVKLEENYRSTANVVKAALSIIQHASDREEKNLFTNKDVGKPVRVVATNDEHDEAAVVASTIQRALKDGTPATEIAVFYRIHALSRVLEESLRRARIPYQIIGGTKFFERKEIKDVLSYLRIVVNPASDVDLLRIINTPTRGIGQSTIKKISAAALRSRRSIYDTIVHDLDSCHLSTGPRKRVVTFADLIERLRTASEQQPLATLMDTLITETGYIEALEKENSARADARIENVREISSSVADFEQEMISSGQQITLSSYLERIALVSAVDESQQQESVSLMTVHAAKGLEFSVVIITGLEEDLFPYHREDPAEIEEERRLAYVAVTRARDELTMTYAGARMLFGTTKYNLASRFLGELPDEITDQHQSESRTYRTNSFQQHHSFSTQPDRKPTPPTPQRTPGERFIDRDIIMDDIPPDDVGLTVGVLVHHKRFGIGKVKSINEQVQPPLVTVSFSGWGTKKILASFLSPA